VDYPALRMTIINLDGGTHRLVLEIGEPGKTCSSGIRAHLEVEDDGHYYRLGTRPVQEWMVRLGQATEDQYVTGGGFDASWLKSLILLLQEGQTIFESFARRDGRYPYNKGP
jgi:hypothetical protein